MRTHPVRNRYPMYFARFIFAEMFRRDRRGGRAASQCERTPLLSLPDVFCPVRSCGLNFSMSLRGPLGPWQSQGIPLDAEHFYTIVYPDIYNGRYVPAQENFLAGDCHVGQSPPRNDMVVLRRSIAGRRGKRERIATPACALVRDDRALFWQTQNSGGNR